MSAAARVPAILPDRHETFAKTAAFFLMPCGKIRNTPMLPAVRGDKLSPDGVMLDSLCHFVKRTFFSTQ